ncbi:MAG: DegT/DnrJ/EryC1/StrS family aminotransferase, partial [Candidatus Omnitrophica bacterium]|nr:DegT/DnrJ/EryC1/StrS family aminotransferase [Candidatus Omnitrophota bacterium]
SPNTFVASANCAVYCQAKPVFLDIDHRTYNLDPVKLAQKITCKTKAVIPVHFAGQSCDMTKIKQIIAGKEQEYGHKIYIIEDACHALGSEYKHEKIGSCKFSDITVMSFHPVKHITTGEGGILLTNDKYLFFMFLLMRSHGITSNAEEIILKENMMGNEVKPGYYEQQFLGYNYRITDIQSALGLSQLKKLPFFIEERRKIVEIYNNEFKDIKHLTIPFENDEVTSNYHLYVVQIDFEKIGKKRTEVILELRKKGIQTQVHYIPVYYQPFYREKFGYATGECPVCEKYYNQCLSIPLFPAMKIKDVEHVVRSIKESIKCV